MDLTRVTIDLSLGENDAQNVGYHSILLDDWATIKDHAVFANIENADPLTIADGGGSVPYRRQD